jgi:uncharacterized protein (DUF58 family)
VRGAGAGLLLVAIGAVIGAGGLVVTGVMIALVVLLRGLWVRFGLRHLTYERRLGATRAVVGEEIPLQLIVRNRKLLPILWLAVDDLVSRPAAIAGHHLEPADVPGFAFLRTTWTLGWFERATRHLRIVAERRGVYEFRSTQLLVADPFAREIVGEERPDVARYWVIPRCVPVRTAPAASLLPGSARVRRGLFEDPAQFAGVRPFQPGDPLRRVHWKATARLGRPVSRRYDPGQEREVVLALDVQTIPGPFWRMQYDEELIEQLCMAAMSLGRSAIDDAVACGLAANAYSSGGRRVAQLAPSAAHGQASRLADELAALSRWPSMPFGVLLGQLARRVRPGTTVLAISAQPPAAFLPVLRRLAGTGRPVRLLALGPEAPGAVVAARALGIPAGIGRLDPDWRTADALELAG